MIFKYIKVIFCLSILPLLPACCWSKCLKKCDPCGTCTDSTVFHEPHMSRSYIEIPAQTPEVKNEPEMVPQEIIHDSGQEEDDSIIIIEEE